MSQDPRCEHVCALDPVRLLGFASKRGRSVPCRYRWQSQHTASNRAIRHRAKNKGTDAVLGDVGASDVRGVLRTVRLPFRRSLYKACQHESLKCSTVAPVKGSAQSDDPVPATTSARIHPRRKVVSLLVLTVYCMYVPARTWKPNMMRNAGEGEAICGFAGFEARMDLRGAEWKGKGGKGEVVV